MEPNDSSDESFDEEVREAREQLRIALYRATDRAGDGRADRSRTRAWLILAASYALLGILTVLEPMPIPNVFAGGLCFVTAGAMFVAWERGRSASRMHRRLIYAVEMHLRDKDRHIENSLETSTKARAAADARHQSNRERQAAAKAFYLAQTWPTKAAAVAAIAKEFHAAPKSVERWISSWNKD